MTINQLASKIAKVEGKKSQARIGDIREILKVMTLICAEEALFNTRVIGTKCALDSQSFCSLEVAIDKVIMKAYEKAAKKKLKQENV